MKQSLSPTADCSSASQKKLRLARNQEVHHRPHKNPPPVPILEPDESQFMPPISNYLKINFHIVLPSTTWSPMWVVPTKISYEFLVQWSGVLGVELLCQKSRVQDQPEAM